MLPLSQLEHSQSKTNSTITAARWESSWWNLGYGAYCCKRTGIFDARGAKSRAHKMLHRGPPSLNLQCTQPAPNLTLPGPPLGRPCIPGPVGGTLGSGACGLGRGRAWAGFWGGRLQDTAWSQAWWPPPPLPRRPLSRPAAPRLRHSEVGRKTEWERGG